MQCPTVRAVCHLFASDGELARKDPDSSPACWGTFQVQVGSGADMWMKRANRSQYRKAGRKVKSKPDPLMTELKEKLSGDLSESGVCLPGHSQGVSTGGDKPGDSYQVC